MRDQQSNAPSGVRMRTGESQYEGGTNGAMREVTGGALRRGYLELSCDEYRPPYNTIMTSDDGGVLGRPHGLER